MCGIIGVLSKQHSIVDALEHGITELQNRGYDSIGFSLLDTNDTFHVQKKVCDHHHNEIQSLFSLVPAHQTFHNGIAHSRWATHGGITQENAHPHLCYQQLFSLVHNGIIENFQELKQTLPTIIPFQSETDSEVIVNLLSHTYHTQTTDETTTMDRVIEAINIIIPMLRGTFGLVIQCRLLPERLFCIRYGSPLVVGVSPTSVMIVSEKSAFPSSITKYVPIDDHDLLILQDDQTNPIQRIRCTTSSQELVFLQNTNIFDNDNPYSTWTEKEIREQADAVQRCIKNGSRILPDNSGVQLGGLLENQEKIQSADHLILLGCGTSYHACLLISKYFRTMRNKIQTVQVCDGSEFDVSLISKSGNTTMIVVSQSGETMDLLLSIKKFKETNPEFLVLGVINVVDSIIARTVDGGLYTNSGKERGVASTKSFTTQVIALYLMACFFSSCHSINPHLQIIRNLPLIIQHNVDNYFQQVREWVCPFVLSFESIFVIGKSYDYHIAMEASLKIKEISYIHAEAYSSSSLKHGPFALLGPEMLVILLSNVPSERKKLENAYQEIKARHAPMIVLSYENIHNCPYYINIPYHYFSYLESNIVLQILALELSLAKNIHPDFPKNLAKVVTVE